MGDIIKEGERNEVECRRPTQRGVTKGGGCKIYYI